MLSTAEVTNTSNISLGEKDSLDRSEVYLGIGVDIQRMPVLSLTNGQTFPFCLLVLVAHRRCQVLRNTIHANAGAFILLSPIPSSKPTDKQNEGTLFIPLQPNPSLVSYLLSSARLTAGVLFLSLSLDDSGVRSRGLAFDLDPVFRAEASSVWGPSVGGGFVDADALRDVPFGGLGLPLSFSLAGVRLRGLGLGSVCCFVGEPELLLVPLVGDELVDIEVVEFERDGGGVGAAAGFPVFAGDERAGVETADSFDPTPARFTEAMSVLLEIDDLFPSAVFGLSLCSSFTLWGVRCDDTARRTW